MSVVDRVAATVVERQRVRWDRLGGPSGLWRWSMHHPWSVTVGVAVVLAGVLAASFGVPPFSPLVLVMALVAPIPFVLRLQQRAYRRWSSSDQASAPETASERDRPRGRPAAGDDG